MVNSISGKNFGQNVSQISAGLLNDTIANMENGLQSQTVPSHAKEADALSLNRTNSSDDSVSTNPNVETARNRPLFSPTPSQNNHPLHENILPRPGSLHTIDTIPSPSIYSRSPRSDEAKAQKSNVGHLFRPMHKPLRPETFPSLSGARIPTKKSLSDMSLKKALIWGGAALFLTGQMSAARGALDDGGSYTVLGLAALCGAAYLHTTSRHYTLGSFFDYLTNSSTKDLDTDHEQNAQINPMKNLHQLITPINVAQSNL